MISVLHSQIPPYLRSSEFYGTLNADEDEHLEVPLNCFKENEQVAFITDMTCMLETIRFWGLTELPEALLDFMLSTVDIDMDHLTKEFPELRFLPAIQELRSSPSSSMIIAIEANLVGVMRFLKSRGHAIEPKHLHAATIKGGTAVITCLLDQNHLFRKNACFYAASGGSLASLKCLHEQGYALCAETASAAAGSGRLDCLRYLHEHGCPWNVFVYTQALKGGHIDGFMYAAEHGCPMSEIVAEACAAAGNLECLTIVHERGGAWNEATCAAAADGGHLASLQYVHERGCAWDVSMARRAAEGGHLPCLQYAHEHGCPWNATVSAAAAGSGSVDCLAYAHEQGCPWGVQTCIAAVEASSLPCLRYALEHRCPVTYPNGYPANIVDIIIRNGQPALIKCAMAHGCRGDRYSLQLASDLINKSPMHTEVYMMLLRDNCGHNASGQIYGTHATKDKEDNPSLAEDEKFEGFGSLFD